MSLWRDEYLDALKECEKKKICSYAQIDDKLIEAFTILLDQTSALEAQKALFRSTLNQDESRNSGTLISEREILLLRSELAEALRSNGQLSLRIKLADVELAKLREKNKSDMNTIEEIFKDRLNLTQKLKDRDEELRGKTKLLDDVYDEIVSLNLQLNMSEQKIKDLKSENQFLVDRWMARKILEWEKTNDGPVE
ncbi:Autophagy protein [Erysiphe necator]|nr:Autophagy protein [Erysiphe necator]